MRDALESSDFKIDLRNQSLWRGAEEVLLRPKTFGVLEHLVRHSGDLVSKDELLDAVWRGKFVADSVVKVSIGELRHVLGDDPRAPCFIETLCRRGYRFIGSVEETGADARYLSIDAGDAPSKP